jgi:hypothetical protein
MKTYILISFLLISHILNAQTWDRIFGYSKRNEVFLNLNESYDGGYFVLGGFHFYPDTRGWVIKTDINGNLLYDISIGTGTGLSQGNYPGHIEPTSDGGFIVCGSHDRWTLNDIGVTKHDACGDLEWCKIFRTDGPDMFDWGRKILQLPDGGYIMLTQGYASNTNNTKIHLFRFDSSGEVIWIEPYALTATHPYIENNGAYDLLINASGDYFMSGFCYWCDDSVATGGWNNPCRLKALTLKADSSRAEQWVSVFRDTLRDQYSSSRFSTEQNGKFYIGANYRINGEFPVMLLINDILGNFIYDTLPQIPDIGEKWAEGYLVDPVFTSDGRMYAHSLMADSTNFYPGWFSLHELDSLGGWHNTFLHPNAHYYGRMIKTSDDKLLAGAVVGSELNQDIILMKFNTSLEYDSIYTAPRVYDYLCPDPIVSKTIDLTDCEVIVNVEDIPTRKEYNARISLIPITPAPNPAKDYVRFLLENTEHHKNIRVVYYDIYGRQMAEILVNSGVNETGLSISGWRHGLYMAVVYSGNKQMGKARFVVE